MGDGWLWGGRTVGRRRSPVPRWMDWRAGEWDERERRQRDREKKCMFIASKAVDSVLV